MSGERRTVGDWLAQHGLGEYAPRFAEQDIDWTLLVTLTDDDLVQLGLPLGHRHKLLQAIASISGPAETTSEASPADLSASAPERRNVTILFADLVGSTQLSTRLDPEDLGQLIQSFQHGVSAAITGHGGFVARYLGDGVLAYFGWPRAHEDDAARAVRAGLAIGPAAAALRTLDGEPLAARVGIATGLVVVGVSIGEGAAKEQVVVGETPNVAARLQAEAAPGQVVIAESTRRLLGGGFELKTLSPRPLKGLSESLAIHVVLGERQAATRFEARAEGALPPLFGRDYELGQLMERWRRARAGEGQGVLLVGEAGIGKSRIVRALLDSLRHEPHIRLKYQCSQYHVDSAIWPVTQQLAVAAGFEPTDGPEHRLDKLEALLAEAGPIEAMDAPVIAALMGLDGSGRYGPLTLTPEALRARTFEALARQLTGLASKRPVVAVVEDAHWVDPTTLELINHVIAAVAEVPALVLLTARPDDAPELADHANISRLPLYRLAREGVEAIVRCLGGERLPESTVAAIVARTDGIPLFVEELTKAVVESGETTVPATLHDTLMARLDRTPEVKEIAQTAACIGREFDLGLLAAIADRPRAELAAGLERLGAAELVFRRGFGMSARYVFKHALVRDAAYESLLRSRRQTMHSRLVLALEAATAGTPPEILALHAERAGMIDRAVDEYVRAGAAAAARPAYAEAIANYDTALRLLGALPQGSARNERTLAIGIARALALVAYLGYGAAETAAAFEHARALAEKVGDPRSLFRVDYGQWGANYVQGQLPQALERGRRAVAACDPDDQADVRTLAHRMVGAPLVMMGRFAEGAVQLQQSVAHYNLERHAGHAQRFGMDTRAHSLAYLGIARWCMGAVDAALVDLDDSLAISRRVDSALARCQGLGHVAIFKSVIDPAGAADLVEEVFALSLRDGVQYWQAVAHGLRAGVRTALGDHAEALEEATRCRDALERRGANVLRPLYMGFAAQAQIALGRFDEARTTLRNIDAMVAAGQGWTESDARRIEGDLLIGRGDSAGAEACWRRAIAVARAQEAASWELRAASRLAGLLADRGAADEAIALLSATLARVDGERGTPDVAAAAALLRELAP